MYLKIRHMPWYHKQPPHRMEEEDQKFSPVGLKLYVLTSFARNGFGNIHGGFESILHYANLERFTKETQKQYTKALEEILNRPSWYGDNYTIMKTNGTPDIESATFSKPLKLHVEQNIHYNRMEDTGWGFMIEPHEILKLAKGTSAYDFDGLFTMLMYLKSRMIYKKCQSASGYVTSIPHSVICEELDIVRSTALLQIEKLVNLGLIGRFTGTNGECNTYSCPPNDLLMQLNAGEIREKHRKSKKYGGVC